MTQSRKSDTRLADLVGALSLATDLSMGQPLEHALRTCLLALRLGEGRGLGYPFIFWSDFTWNVDVCAEVPEGYVVAGVYDTDGTLVSGGQCVQTLIAGEDLVVAFGVVEVGSPEPHMRASLRARGPNGRPQRLDLNIPGRRNYLPRGPHAEQAAHGVHVP